MHSKIHCHYAYLCYDLVGIRLQVQMSTLRFIGADEPLLYSVHMTTLCYRLDHIRLCEGTSV